MAASFSHAAQHLSQLLISHFLLIWMLLLVLVPVCGLLASSLWQPILSRTSPVGESTGKLESPRPLTLADGIAAAGFAIFLILYIVVIFYKEDFAYYDNDQLTDFSLRGRNFPPPIWPDAGRFFPLGFQEFNVLALITKSLAGFHTLAVIQLVILLLAIMAVLDGFKPFHRVLILMLAMLAPSFMIPFTELIYPERNVLFWLAIMVWCLYSHSKTKASIYFIGCLIATHFALYYKETVVVFVVACAVTRILLESHAGRAAGHSWRELARENSLSLGMLAVSGIYGVLFLATMLPHGNPSYLGAHRQALGSVLLAYAQTDWLPLVLFAVFIIRVQRFIFSDGELDPLWESLAVGALGYFAVVLALRLVSAYYMAPVDLIAVLYTARSSLAWLSKPTRLRVSIVAAVFTCILFQNLAYSSFRMIERKNVIAVKKQFADFLRSYQWETNTLELFFPYASQYHLMGLSAYLRYRGFPLVGQSAPSGGAGPRLLIEGPQDFLHNRCVDYRDYACTHADRPGEGALIVVLPDDTVSMRDVENISKASALLLSIKACEVCTRDGSWFRKLHAISAEFSESQLPQHWLQLHVFKKT